MTTFQQDRRAKSPAQCLRRFLHLSPPLDSRCEPQARFVEIWCYKRCQWKKLVFVSINRRSLEKTIAASRNHNRIDNQWDAPPECSVAVLNRLCRSVNDPRRAKQAGLDRFDLEI